MPSFDLFAVFGVVLVFVLIGILFLIPTDRRPKRLKKSRVEKQKEQSHKDWKAASVRLEKHVYDLRKDILQGKRREKKYERDLTVQQQKYKKLQEKLAQERGWQSKEKGDIEKKTQELIRSKEDLKNTEKNLEREHSQRLALEREVREFKGELTQAKESKRGFETQIAKLQAQADAYRKDILELRESNNKLSKKNDEDTFIAKSEYLRLEKELRDKGREVDNLKELIRKKGLG